MMVLAGSCDGQTSFYFIMVQQPTEQVQKRIQCSSSHSLFFYRCVTDLQVCPGSLLMVINRLIKDNRGQLSGDLKVGG